MAEKNKRTYTEEQKKAIFARGGSVLVSAAAGSGKTSVLTERVIRLITDEKNPVRADRLLIVTFTKTAAAEMKQRIIEQLRERLCDEPNNTNLKHQLLFIQNADICTIDSFCSKIVKENFFALGVRRDLRIASDSELKVIKQDAIEETLEELYKESIENGENDFSLLSDALSSSKSDAALTEAIFSIYDSILSHPFPMQWIKNAVEMYETELPFGKTEWGKIALKNLGYAVDYMKKVSDTITESLEERLGEIESEVSRLLSSGARMTGDNKKVQENAEKLAQKIIPFKQYQEFSKKLYDILSSDKDMDIWDEIVQAVNNFAPASPDRKRLSAEYSDITSEIKNFRSELDSILKNIKNIFSKSSKECSEELKDSAVLAHGLYKAIVRFDEKFKAAKDNKGIADFSDIEHLALKLLVTENGERTDQSREIAVKYDEIIIDEYQDTNMVQETIFGAISKNEENLFTVGDVKQSIYHFREAMPDIFLNRRDKYITDNRTNSEKTNYPPIFLSGNFRSRKGIIGSVNFIFSQLMSERVGEVIYDDNEKLFAQASYPDTDEPETELHVVMSHKSYNAIYEDEAKHIANIIEDTVGHMMIKVGNEMRPAKYSDICILMRSPKKHIKTYIKIFEEYGIPVSGDMDEDLFDRSEIKLLLAFLTAVDNPRKDIPLTSVMMSPIYGFTPDDMAKIRMSSNAKKIYPSLCQYVSSEESEDIVLKDRCKDFLNELQYYRTLSSTVPSDRFLEIFFARSGLMAVVGAEKDGEIRIKNIRKILNLARDYEKNGFRGLSGFIRTTERLKETKGSLSVALKKEDEDVKIMSIHGSKGLEFPICILAANTASGNSNHDSIIYHHKLGIAFKKYDMENLYNENTTVRTIIENEKSREETSEEMRIFYVALTRAKEKLYLINTYSKTKNSLYETKIEPLISKLPTNGVSVEPYAVENCSTLAEWILLCALRHPSMTELRKEGNSRYIGVIPSESKWKYIYTEIENHDKAEEIANEPILDIETDKILKGQILKSLEFQYPQTELVYLPTKVSASQLSHEGDREKFMVESKPKFMSNGKIQGAQRGTAFHEFLHYADIFSDNFDFDSEIIFLKEKGFLSYEQAESVEKELIQKFLDSKLFNRMKNADRVMREYRFAVTIPASTVNKEISNENANVPIFMQGAIDCVFIESGKAVIVDYKTDRVKSSKILTENYSKQLMLYKNALEQTENIEVSECIIYSLLLGEETTVEFN